MQGPYILLRGGKRSKPFSPESLRKLVDSGQCGREETLMNSAGETALVRDVLEGRWQEAELDCESTAKAKEPLWKRVAFVASWVWIVFTSLMILLSIVTWQKVASDRDEAEARLHSLEQRKTDRDREADRIISEFREDLQSEVDGIEDRRRGLKKEGVLQ